MAQYREGTVTVTNGSATVALQGGTAVGNISAGDWFILTDESVPGNGVPYFVAADATLAGQFALTAPWAGTTAVGKIYAVHRDFDGDGIAILSGGEAAVAALINRNNQILKTIGGGGGSFQSILGGFTFSGASHQVAVVDAAESSLTPSDIRFVQKPLIELAPTSVASRLVHYSALSGTLNSTGGVVTQWNDLSGNNRHATQNAIGPRLVGQAGRASYGLNFESSSDAGDDRLMIATVPAAQNTMTLFYVGRVDQRHAVNANLWKTAHAASIDSQTAGDIELAVASSGTTLNLRISTSAALGQIVALGPYKNGLVFVLALVINNGAVTGFVQGQGELTATSFSGSYTHGTGFNTDRVRLGYSPDVETGHVIHELMLTSTAVTTADLRRLMIWAQNRYFRSPLVQDEADPLFFASPDFGGQWLRNHAQAQITTDGVNIEELFRPSRTLTSPDSLTVKLAWSSGLFFHTGDGEFQLTLLATAPVGWALDIEQQAFSGGSVTIILASGASNLGGFGTSVQQGDRLAVRCVRNTTGGAAQYVGYLLSPTGGGGGGGGGGQTMVFANPGDGDYSLSAGPTENIVVIYNSVLTADRTVTIESSALTGVHLAYILHMGSGFNVEVIDVLETPVVTLAPDSAAEICMTVDGAFVIRSGPIAIPTGGGLTSSAITDLPEETAIAGTDLVIIADASASFAPKKMTRTNFVAGITGGAADTYNEVDDSANYSSTAFVVGTGGADKNEFRRFTANNAHIINFPINIPLDSYGAFHVLETAGATIRSAATVTVNGLADRGGANPAITVHGFVTWWLHDDGTITVRGDTGEETKAFGNHNHQDKLLTRPILKDYAEQLTSVSSASGVLTLNIELGNAFRCQMTENITSIVFTNPPANNLIGSVLLYLVQDTTPRTVSFSGIGWPSAVAPTISSGSGALDIFMFLTRDAGANWRGFVGGQNY